MNTTIAVIICTRNRLNDLLYFFESLTKQTLLPTELIIVDSSDTALTEDAAFSEKFLCISKLNIKTIYIHTKPGLTLQRNIGVSLISSELTYFFDDDVFLEPDYLEKMTQFYINNPTYFGGMGAVTNLATKKNNIFRAIRSFFLLQKDYARGNFRFSGMPTHTYGTDKLKTVQVLGGCCMSFRTAIFKEFKFDENLCRYGAMEDCDFSKRVSTKYKLFFNPDARLQHFSSLVSRDKAQDASKMYIYNYSYLFFKNFFCENKLRVFGYLWSISGLFVESLIFRDLEHFKGYVKGFKAYWLGEKL